MSALTWLDRYFTEREIQNHGSPTPFQSTIDFEGAGVTVADDPTNERTVVTIGGGGAALPITAPGATSGTLTALDRIPTTDILTIGRAGVATYPATYWDEVLIVAKTSIEWAVGSSGLGQLFVDANGLHVANTSAGHYLGFLAAEDPTTLPATGLVRLPYNAAAPVVVLAVKDSASTDRSFITYGAADAWFVGNAFQDLHLTGYLGTEIVISAGFQFNGGTANFNGAVVFNAGTTSTSVAVAALDVDWSLSDLETKTLAAGGNTFTFSNTREGTIVVILTSDPGGSTVTWPAGILWPGGVVPTQTPTGTDVYTFIKAGSTIYGAAQQAMA